MSTRFYVGQKDYITQLNAMDDAINAAGSSTNPRFTTFGGSWLVPDVRPSKKKPQDYLNNASVIEFNNSESFDSPPGMVSAFYPYVMTVSGYTASGAGGGGLPVQLNFGDSLSYRRGSSASTWAPWKRVTSYDDQIAAFGSPTSKNTILVVGGDGTTNGASTLIQNGGGTIIAMGNKSAVIGGAYDNTPFLYAPYPIECSAGMKFSNQIQIKGSSELVRLNDDQCYISFYNTANTTRTAYIQAASGSSLALMADGGTTAIKFGVAGSFKALIDYSGNFYPLADNSVSNLGQPSNRWNTVYAGTGTINTSDAREKTPVSKLTDAEISAAKDLGKEIGTYKWLAALQNKGDDARLHIGMTVQRAIEIMQSHALDPFAYGFICYDKWDAKSDRHQTNIGLKVAKTRLNVRQVQKVTKSDTQVTEVQMINGIPTLVTVTKHLETPVFQDVPVLNPDGSPVMIQTPDHLSDTLVVLTDAPQVKLVPMTHKVPVMETVQTTETYEEDAEPVYETVVTQAAGDRYAFRYDELNMFIAAGFEARLHALENK